ncbi:MAG TPA: hypothetical protein VGA60_11875 [Kiloniellales bacterium]|jgi:hypothetical protein
MLRSPSMILSLLLAAGVASGAASGVVGAGEIPPSALDSDYVECMRSGDELVDTTRWTNYCACALQGVQEQFDLEEYTALFRAMMMKQPGEAGSVAKLEGIRAACEAETLN